MSDNSSAIKQPEWFAPDESKGSFLGLNVLNSLTSSKVKFVPSSGKRVTWYICGPTTYDSSHLGHARNYVTFDIIRRILEDYFGYEVFSVMNITDVDDKIILKARRSYLYDKYEKENNQTNEKVVGDLKEAWTKFVSSLEKKIKETSEDNDKKLSEKAAEVKLLQEKLEEAKSGEKKVREIIAQSVAQSNNNNGDKIKEILSISKEPLSILLDGREGHTVTDPTIFRATAAIYEDEFLEDMKTLNVKMPDVLTRVTEFIPEVIDYVQKIIDNKYAYESDGSVYFDTKAFAKNHPYAKLRPWAVGNAKLIQEGEGSLTTGTGKKHPNDFALWKKSKTGEPAWESPNWGRGRPGWHIECSAMASALLGETLDIHSGGEDLCFPHHDNEIAQAEAYFDNKQWVNYFLHSGHLHIEGLKMSKSLKNFITIRQALEKASPRQLRLMFLSQPWDRTMNYSVDALETVRNRERTINEFYLVIRSIMQQQDQLSSIDQHWNSTDLSLHNYLLKSQDNIDLALKDNFDTPKALTEITDLVKETNKYIMENKGKEKSLLLRKIGLYVTKILRIWGVIFERDLYSINSSSESVDTEKVLNPYLTALSNYRSSVRSAAIAKKDPSEFMKLSDELRDDVLPPLGVRLEDSGLIPFKLDNPEVIMKDIADRKLQAVAVQKKKLEGSIKLIKTELEELEKGKETPRQMFEREGFKAFDEEGIPTIDKDDKEITKSAGKKYKKILENQQKIHLKYQEKIGKDSDYVAKKQNELNELISKLNSL